LRLFPRSNPSLTKTPVPLLFPSLLSTNDVSVSVTRVRRFKDSSCWWSVDEEKLSRLSSHPFQSSLKMILSPCFRAMNFPFFVTMLISWWPGLFPLPAIPAYPNSYYLIHVSTGVERNSPTGIPWVPTRSCRFTRKVLEKASTPVRRSLFRPLFTSIETMSAPDRRTKSTS